MSVFKRTEYLDSIRFHLAMIATYLALGAAIGFQDEALVTENFVAGLLNRLLGLDLKNLNLGPSQEPFIDLGDSEKGVAVQVTISNRKDKIQKQTLDRFFEADLDKTYATVYIVVFKERYSPSSEFITPAGFTFDKREHVLDLRALMRLINAKSTVGLKQLAEYIAEEVSSPPIQQRKYTDRAVRLLKQLPLIRTLNFHHPDFKTWKRLLTNLIEDRYGKDSSQLADLNRIRWNTSEIEDAHQQFLFMDGCNDSESFLKALLIEDNPAYFSEIEADRIRGRFEAEKANIEAEIKIRLEAPLRKRDAIQVLRLQREKEIRLQLATDLMQLELQRVRK